MEYIIYKLWDKKKKRWSKPDEHGKNLIEVARWDHKSGYLILFNGGRYKWVRQYDYKLRFVLMSFIFYLVFKIIILIIEIIR